MQDRGWFGCMLKFLREQKKDENLKIKMQYNKRKVRNEIRLVKQIQFKKHSSKVDKILKRMEENLKTKETIGDRDRQRKMNNATKLKY